MDFKGSKVAYKIFAKMSFGWSAGDVAAGVKLLLGWEKPGKKVEVQKANISIPSNSWKALTE